MQRSKVGVSSIFTIILYISSDNVVLIRRLLEYSTARVLGFSYFLIFGSLECRDFAGCGQLQPNAVGTIKVKNVPLFRGNIPKTKSHIFNSQGCQEL
jgi:hypothetical protein